MAGFAALNVAGNGGQLDADRMSDKWNLHVHFVSTICGDSADICGALFFSCPIYVTVLNYKSEQQYASLSIWMDNDRTGRR